jgi:hypothetical protein
MLSYILPTLRYYCKDAILLQYYCASSLAFGAAFSRRSGMIGACAGAVSCVLLVQAPLLWCCSGEKGERLSGVLSGGGGGVTCATTTLLAGMHACAALCAALALARLLVTRTVGALPAFRGHVGYLSEVL